MAGYVDDHLPYYVADNDEFWMMYKGPCYCVVADGATITEGDVLQSDVVTAYNDLDGVLTVVDTATNATTAAIMSETYHIVGRAMEAKVASSGVLKIRVLLSLNNGL